MKYLRMFFVSLSQNRHSLPHENRNLILPRIVLLVATKDFCLFSILYQLITFKCRKPTITYVLKQLIHVVINKEIRATPFFVYSIIPISHFRHTAVKILSFEILEKLEFVDIHNDIRYNLLNENKVKK